MCGPAMQRGAAALLSQRERRTCWCQMTGSRDTARLASVGRLASADVVEIQGDTVCVVAVQSGVAIGPVG